MTPTVVIAWSCALGAVVSAVFLFALEAARQARRGVEPRRAVLRQRRVGGLMFAAATVVPLAIVAPAWLPDLLTVDHPLALLIAVGATALVILPVVARASRAPDHLEHYPALPPRAPMSRWWPVNAGTWLFYLLGYEAFFRGLLVLFLDDVAGLTAAIGISTVFYVIVHLGKNPGEVVGSAVMGPVFAWAALASGSILTPWLMHGLIALSNDVFAVRRLRATPGWTP